MGPPLISLCLIARDEERFLPECLRRAAPAADEIILVDTGSRDRTREIARSAGAAVLEYPWRDDFAAARNFGLDRARGRWILVLDADELLEEGAAEEIRAAAGDPRLGACHLTFRNLHDGGREIRNLMVRMFLRTPEVRYRNRIHEQVIPSLVPWLRSRGLRIGVVQTPVRHLGYLGEVAASKGKVARNLRLFEAQVREYPDDAYSWYRYGDYLRGLRERGIEAPDPGPPLNRANRLLGAMLPGEWKATSFAPEAAALLALEVRSRNDLMGACRVAWRALRHPEPTPNLLYVAAGLALDTSRPADALRLYRSLRALEGQVRVVPPQPGVTGHLAEAGIGRALAALGREDEAARHLGESLRLEPSYRPARAALAEVLVRAGRFRDALPVLAALLRETPEDPGLALRTGETLLRLGRPRESRPWLERAAAAAGGDPRPRVLLSRSALALGLPGEASAILREAAECGPVLAGRAVLEALSGDTPVVPDLREVEEWTSTLRACGRTDWAEAIEGRIAAGAPGG